MGLGQHFDLPRYWVARIRDTGGLKNEPDGLCPTTILPAVTSFRPSNQNRKAKEGKPFALQKTASPTNATIGQGSP
jgi:hypothetical protein